QSMAMYRAEGVFEQISQEYKKLTGREYPILDLYRMDDAEVVLFVLNSASEISKVAVDKLRDQGVKAGLIAPNMIRPFPAKNMVLEVKAALFSHGVKDIHVISRIYGLGGKDFYLEDAIHFLETGMEAIEKGEVEKPFDYYGHTPGDPAKAPKRVVEPIPYEELNTGLIK
ncbi:hypothetical protein U6Q21_12655, partial [Cutibacterium acnes]